MRLALGGCFIGPLTDFECQYWRHFQKELAINPENKKLDAAMLEYCEFHTIHQFFSKNT